MSHNAAGTALKTSACSMTVSALRNHVHYVLNYVFEGCRPGDPRGEVVDGGRLQKLEHRRAHSPHNPTTAPIMDAPLKPTPGPLTKLAAYDVSIISS